VPDTKFQPGVSGNARGRPRRKSVRELVGEKGLADIIAAITKAAQGASTMDSAAVAAAKLLIPPQKPELARVVIPALETAQTHLEQANAITRAAARGEISADTASALSATIANAAKIAELDELSNDLAKRIEALEKNYGPAKPAHPG
jgi:hypothetical protein